MKKIFAFICVAIGVGALGVSSVPRIMHKIWDWNNVHINRSAWWCKHSNMGGGDLVKLSYLDDIKKFWAYKDYQFPKAADSGRKNINLYIYGDSYTEDIPDSAFANVNEYHYNTKLKPKTYLLDTGKRNILIIEITERLTLESFSGPAIYNVLKCEEPVPPAPVKNEPVQPGSATPAATPQRKARYTLVSKTNYSQIINTNLEYVLFDYKAINRIRQYKADMNYGLFHHASGDVAISDNGQYIFFKPTVEQGGTYSCYTPVPDDQLNSTVSTLNEIYEHYKRAGFAEVYFSVIPGAATILQPDNYNGFIPRLYNNPVLKMPVIDVYSIYKKNADPASLYRKGDTHWNNNGLQIWLGLVNNELRRQSSMQR